MKSILDLFRRKKQPSAASPANKRDVALDVAKGLAIILVVFSHVLETYTVDWATVSRLWYWAAIHHFSMALFMFISGYLAYRALDFKWLSRRSLQLILPFVVWSIVYYFVFLDEAPSAGAMTKSVLYYAWTLNTSGLWFLPALFGLFVLLYLVRGNTWGILGVIALAYFLSQMPLPLAQLHLSRTAWFSVTAWFMPFFAGGYLIAKYRRKLHSLSFVKWFCLVAFPVFFLLGGEMNYTSTAFSWPDLPASLTVILTGFYRFWMSLLGIGMTFAVADLISRLAAVRRVPQYLGGVTLGVYCAHSLFRSYGVGNGVIRVLLTTLAALLLSSALIWLLQKLRITDFLFLGGAPKLFSRKVTGLATPLAHG